MVDLAGLRPAEFRDESQKQLGKKTSTAYSLRITDSVTLKQRVFSLRSNLGENDHAEP